MYIALFYQLVNLIVKRFLSLQLSTNLTSMMFCIKIICILPRYTHKIENMLVCQLFSKITQYSYVTMRNRPINKA